MSAMKTISFQISRNFPKGEMGLIVFFSYMAFYLKTLKSGSFIGEKVIKANHTMKRLGNE